MKKFKLLRFGHCYINREGDFAVALLHGDKKHGYQFAASHAHPLVWLGKIQMLSRVVPNDENWREIDLNTFKAASAFHATGHVIKFVPSVHGKEQLPVVSKKY